MVAVVVVMLTCPRMAEALRHLMLRMIVGSHSYRPVTITGLSQMDGGLERELEEWLASLKLCALFIFIVKMREARLPACST